MDETPAEQPLPAIDWRKWVASGFATLSVVASLVFVAVELQQNTTAVRAATYDRLAESSVAYLYQIADNEEVAALFTRVFAGETRERFTEVERTRITAVVIALLMHLENAYRQYEAGIVGEDIFESYGWGDGLLRSAYFRGSGATEWSFLFDDEFLVFLEAHLAREGVTVDDLPDD